MKTYEFYATTDLGGDGETYFDVELTDEESALLEKYGKKSSVYYDFCECEELSEIYNKVYEEAVQVLTEELLEYEEDADDDWRADDTYSIHIHLPSEFENDLED